jgi:hypothetical protein
MLISFLDGNVTLGIRFQDLKFTMECTATAVLEIHAQNVFVITYRTVTSAVTFRVDFHVLVFFELEGAAALHITEQLEVPFSFVGKNFHFVCLVLLSH